MQEVKAVRQAKTAAEESAKKQKATNIQKVAELERAVKKKTRDMERHANNPVDPQPQVRQTRKQSEAIDEGTSCL
jgi:hypothetical protein